MKNIALRTLKYAAVLLAVSTPSWGRADVVVVNPGVALNPAAGILVTPLTVVTLQSATGTVNLGSTDGNYVTDANGTIVTAPTPGSGAANFFTNFATPVGVTPVVGGTKGIPAGFNAVGTLSNAPFGALIYGFSTVANPATLSDFIGGTFNLAGAGPLAIPVPAGAVKLYFAVNDLPGARGDNTGSFTVTYTAVPEPGPIALALVGGLGVLAARRRFAKS